MAEKTRKPRARPDYFSTTIPVLRPCPTCRVWLAAGIAEGMHVRVDLIALDPSQTMLALLLSLRLFSLTRTGLVEMDRHRIRDPRFNVRYPEHRCGVLWDSNLPGAGPVIPPATSGMPPY